MWHLYKWISRLKKAEEAPRTIQWWKWRIATMETAKSYGIIFIFRVVWFELFLIDIALCGKLFRSEFRMEMHIKQKHERNYQHDPWGGIWEEFEERFMDFINEQLKTVMSKIIYNFIFRVVWFWALLISIALCENVSERKTECRCKLYENMDAHGRDFYE